MRSTSQGPRVSNFNSHIARMNRIKKQKKPIMQINGPAIINPHEEVDPVFSSFVAQSIRIK